MKLGTKNIGFNVKIVIFPLMLLAFVGLVSFIIGGLTLVWQGLVRWVYGALVGIPFLFIIAAAKKSKRKK